MSSEIVAFARLGILKIHNGYLTAHGMHYIVQYNCISMRDEPSCQDLLYEEQLRTYTTTLRLNRVVGFRLSSVTLDE